MDGVEVPVPFPFQCSCWDAYGEFDKLIWSLIHKTPAFHCVEEPGEKFKKTILPVAISHVVGFYYDMFQEFVAFAAEVSKLGELVSAIGDIDFFEESWLNDSIPFGVDGRKSRPRSSFEEFDRMFDDLESQLQREFRVLGKPHCS